MLHDTSYTLHSAHCLLMMDFSKIHSNALGQLIMSQPNTSTIRICLLKSTPNSMAIRNTLQWTHEKCGPWRKQSENVHFVLILRPRRLVSILFMVVVVVVVVVQVAKGEICARTLLQRASIDHQHNPNPILNYVFVMLAEEHIICPLTQCNNIMFVYLGFQMLFVVVLVAKNIKHAKKIDNKS